MSDAQNLDLEIGHINIKFLSLWHYCFVNRISRVLELGVETPQ